MSEPTPTAVEPQPAAPATVAPAPPARRWRWQLVIGLSVVVILAAGLAVWFFTTRDTRDDLTKLQGEWKFTRYGIGNDRGPSTVVRVSGDRWTIVTEGVERTTHRIELNPAASPKEIDLIWVQKDGDPNVFKDRAGRPVEMRLVGVYALDGETLTIAHNPAHEGRPTSLDGKDHPVSTYTRVTK
jgi:uncharacterized protein (TIGR03067 family)